VSLMLLHFICRKN